MALSVRIDNAPRPLYSPELALAKADQLQAGDPSWAYSAVHSVGLSCIEVRDEDNVLIGYM